MESVLFVITGLIFLYFLFRNRSRKGKDIPGPRGLPLIGSMLEISPENLHSKAYHYAEKYGEIVQLSLVGRKVIFLNTSEIINRAFCEGEAKLCLNDRPMTHFGDVFWAGVGVATSKDGRPGGVNSQLRKVFTKGFHVYGDGIVEFENNVSAEIHHMIEEVEKRPEKEWEVVQTIQQSLANLVCVLLTGEPFANTADGTKWMVDFNETLDFLVSPKAEFLLSNMPWIKYVPGEYRENYRRCWEARENLLEVLLEQMKKTYKPGQVRGFTDFLLEEERTSAANEETLVTESVIRAILMEFVAAGFTTTLGTLTAIILYLLNHPEYQDRIYKEIDGVMGDRIPSLQDKSKCPLTEAVIMEALRIAPVALLGAPHTTYQDVNCGEYNVPRGSLVFANLWYVLHDEKIWGDPWTFRPDRFLDESGQLLPRSHPFRQNLIPFGLGRRQCIGETFARSRIFLYTASIFQRWKLKPSGDKCPSCDPRSDQFKAKFLLHAKPFFCRVERRK